MAEGKKEEEAGRRIVFSYPMAKYVDMSDKMKLDCIEICSSALEKHTDNAPVRQICCLKKNLLKWF